MSAKAYLALDLGADSGRGVLGIIERDRLRLEVVHRFRNGPVRLVDGLHWDVLGLFTEMKNALAAAARGDCELAGIGTDTWGVDFALLGRGDVLLGNPYHYRDTRTVGMFEQAFARVAREEIFERTGIQFLPFNTLYQLLAMRISRSPLLDMAERLLMMPDLFGFWFAGCKLAEFTDATTTQAYDPRQGEWAWSILDALEIPRQIMPEIVPPGTVLGELLEAVAEETGAPRIPVIAPASHDTASAVAAVPADANRSWVFLSSGTWSLMGAEVREPIINDKSLRYNFTNEGGVEGTFRFLKNIMGLWLLQESRRTWQRAGQEYSYDELSDLARAARPFQALIDPDDPRFIPPGDMPSRIAEFCKQTRQKPPQDVGEFVRCIFDSLALKYRWVLERIEECTGRSAEVIHIVGGGSQDRLLCQLAADATGRLVVTGPVEATAAGNVLMQAIATGQLGSVEQGRELIRRSFDVQRYEPRPEPAWQEAYERFVKLLPAG